MNPIAVTALSSAESIPMNACKKPIKTTTRSAKKISDSFIMTYANVSVISEKHLSQQNLHTFNTTSIAPKKRKPSRYSKSRR